MRHSFSGFTVYSVLFLTACSADHNLVGGGAGVGGQRSTSAGGDPGKAGGTNAGAAGRRGGAGGRTNVGNAGSGASDNGGSSNHQGGSGLAGQNAGGVSRGGATPGGGRATGATGGIDCALVGCAAPPLCSTGCTEVCGCCPCVEGTMENGLVCTGGCWEDRGGETGGRPGTGGSSSGGGSSTGGAPTGGRTNAGGSAATGGAAVGGANAGGAGGGFACGGLRCIQGQYCLVRDGYSCEYMASCCVGGVVDCNCLMNDCTPPCAGVCTGDYQQGMTLTCSGGAGGAGGQGGSGGTAGNGGSGGGACNNAYQPVCGSDGISYFNDCLRQAAGVATSSSGSCGVNVARCGGIAGEPCPSTTAVCAYLSPDVSACMISDAFGECWELPNACPATVGGQYRSCDSTNPVCADLCSAARTQRSYFVDATCPAI
jgi:hypothetical protein